MVEALGMPLERIGYLVRDYESHQFFPCSTLIFVAIESECAGEFSLDDA
jgi:hypothetical protein